MDKITECHTIQSLDRSAQPRDEPQNVPTLVPQTTRLKNRPSRRLFIDSSTSNNHLQSMNDNNLTLKEKGRPTFDPQGERESSVDMRMKSPREVVVVFLQFRKLKLRESEGEDSGRFIS